uniref:Sushi domain-containing protein n=1 Tax=Chromera velia CCMP2878 TaxID=1169474 RepID=A0A0G4GIL5_9ALVE|eukprot:Cvel_4761.t1-p1 / transcript=Cvel_4761.t1 / gene=Cvel_4761 / organism=Chromera_velia_CCMP2878 / gene_product=Complement factor H-related protein 5, putative / transcript_product=Complement factor H-related protein 5, putative / location=Cvel_scaffold212:50762-66909(+) / protein_length=2483 / sequence_SO=supercontig / SO=protein_coding / is_pseudo=false
MRTGAVLPELMQVETVSGVSSEACKWGAGFVLLISVGFSEEARLREQVLFDNGNGLRILTVPLEEDRLDAERDLVHVGVEWKEDPREVFAVRACFGRAQVLIFSFLPCRGGLRIDVFKQKGRDSLAALEGTSGQMYALVDPVDARKVEVEGRWYLGCSNKGEKGFHGVMYGLSFATMTGALSPELRQLRIIDELRSLRSSVGQELFCGDGQVDSTEDCDPNAPLSTEGGSASGCSCACASTCPAFELTEAHTQILESSGGKDSGDWRKIGCLQGFGSEDPTSDSALVFCKDGAWEKSPFRCKRNCAGTFQPPPHLLVTGAVNSTRHHTVLEIMCEGTRSPAAGHPLSSTVACVDGIWTPPLIQCFKKCPDFPSLGDAYVQSSAFSNFQVEGHLRHGHTVTIECNSAAGYEAGRRSNEIRISKETEDIVCIDGEWSPRSLECSALCPVYEKPMSPYRLVTREDALPELRKNGDAVKVACIEGASPVGGLKEEDVLCVGSQWAESLLECALDCPSADNFPFPPEFPKEHYELQFGGSHHGDKSSIKCKEGFGRPGAVEEVQCLFGAFEETSLPCDANCPHFDVSSLGESKRLTSESASAHGSVLAGASLTVECASGWTPAGAAAEETIVCRDGQWTEASLECTKSRRLGSQKRLWKDIETAESQMNTPEITFEFFHDFCSENCETAQLTARMKTAEGVEVYSVEYAASTGEVLSKLPDTLTFGEQFKIRCNAEAGYSSSDGHGSAFEVMTCMSEPQFLQGESSPFQGVTQFSEASLTCERMCILSDLHEVLASHAYRVTFREAESTEFVEASKLSMPKLDPEGEVHIICEDGFAAALLGEEGEDGESVEADTREETLKCSGGNFSERTLQCGERCEEFTELEHSPLYEVKGHGHSPGNQRHISCAPGSSAIRDSFGLARREESVACVGGEWTLRTIVCKQDCTLSELPNAREGYVSKLIEGGVSNEKGQFSHGAVWAFECAGGFSHVRPPGSPYTPGRQDIRCQDGRFDPLTMLCMRTCGRFGNPDPTLYVVEEPQGFGGGVHGDYIQLKCADGASISYGNEEDKIFCFDGTWEARTVACTQTCGELTETTSDPNRYYDIEREVISNSTNNTNTNETTLVNGTEPLPEGSMPTDSSDSSSSISGGEDDDFGSEEHEGDQLVYDEAVGIRKGGGQGEDEGEGEGTAFIQTEGGALKERGMGGRGHHSHSHSHRHSHAHSIHRGTHGAHLLSHHRHSSHLGSSAKNAKHRQTKQGMESVAAHWEWTAVGGLHGRHKDSPEEGETEEGSLPPETTDTSTEGGTSTTTSTTTTIPVTSPEGETAPSEGESPDEFDSDTGTPAVPLNESAISNSTASTNSSTLPPLIQDAAGMANLTAEEISRQEELLKEMKEEEEKAPKVPIDSTAEAYGVRTDPEGVSVLPPGVTPTLSRDPYLVDVHGEKREAPFASISMNCASGWGPAAGVEPAEVNCRDGQYSFLQLVCVPDCLKTHFPLYSPIKPTAAYLKDPEGLYPGHWDGLPLHHRSMYTVGCTPGHEPWPGSADPWEEDHMICAFGNFSVMSIDCQKTCFRSELGQRTVKWGNSANYLIETPQDCGDLSCEKPGGKVTLACSSSTRSPSGATRQDLVCFDGDYQEPSIRCYSECPTYTPQEGMRIASGSSTLPLARMELGCVEGWSSRWLHVDEEPLIDQTELREMVKDPEALSCLAGAWEKKTLQCYPRCYLPVDKGEGYNYYPHLDTVKEKFGDAGLPHGYSVKVSCSAGYGAIGSQQDTYIRCEHGRLEYPDIQCFKNCQPLETAWEEMKSRSNAYHVSVEAPVSKGFEENAVMPHGAAVVVRCSASALPVYSRTRRGDPDHSVQTILCRNGEWEKPTLRCEETCKALNEDPRTIYFASHPGYQCAWRLSTPPRNESDMPIETTNPLACDRGATNMDEYRSGTEVEVKCAEGYHRSGHPPTEVIQCVDGTWTGAYTECRKSCGPFEVPESLQGRVSVHSTIPKMFANLNSTQPGILNEGAGRHGETRVVTCRESDGFYPVNVRSLRPTGPKYMERLYDISQCTDGLWSPVHIQCERKCSKRFDEVLLEKCLDYHLTSKHSTCYGLNRQHEMRFGPSRIDLEARCARNSCSQSASFNIAPYKIWKTFTPVQMDVEMTAHSDADNMEKDMNFTDLLTEYMAHADKPGVTHVVVCNKEQGFAPVYRSLENSEASGRFKDFVGEVACQDGNWSSLPFICERGCRGSFNMYEESPSLGPLKRILFSHQDLQAYGYSRQHSTQAAMAFDSRSRAFVYGQGLAASVEGEEEGTGGGGQGGAEMESLGDPTFVRMGAHGPLSFPAWQSWLREHDGAGRAEFVPRSVFKKNAVHTLNAERSEIFRWDLPLSKHWAVWGPGCCDPMNCWKGKLVSEELSASECSSRWYSRGTWVAFERLREGVREPERPIFYAFCDSRGEWSEVRASESADGRTLMDFYPSANRTVVREFGFSQPVLPQVLLPEAPP